jgi:hypothetical protein
MDQASARQSGSENVLARNSALTADFLPADFIAKEMVKEMGRSSACRTITVS